MIQKEKWPPNPKFEPTADIMSIERRMKLVWKFHLKPKTVSELTVTPEKKLENFLQKKMVSSFRKRLTEYVNAGRYFLVFAITQSVHIYGVYVVVYAISVI